jgi:Tol biopolymer transport system component
MAQPFDVKRLVLSGDPFPVAEPIQTQLFGGVPSGVFSASVGGVLVYETGGAPAAGSQLAWFDRAGKQVATLGDRGGYADVELSPDGKQASVTMAGSGATSSQDVWLIDVARGIRTRLTVDPANDNRAIWSADGTRLVFFSNRQANGELYQRSSNGAGADEVLPADGGNKAPSSFSTDGKYLLYTSVAPGRRPGAGPGAGASELWVLPLTGDRKSFAFLKSSFPLVQARFSPDGRWVAYVSTENGRQEVYVTPFPGPGGRIQVSTTGGTWPRWRRDGKEIFYINNEASAPSLIAAAVQANGAAFEVGATQPLFSFQLGGPRSTYDVTADGQRFLVNTRGEQAPTAPSPLTVVVNWTAALGRDR